LAVSTTRTARVVGKLLGKRTYRRLPDDEAAPYLARAKARLDRLDAYPRPVRTDRVRVLVWPEFFSGPKLSRYRGYALWRTIVLRNEPEPGRDDNLITHELCHVWQGQHRLRHMLWTYATTRYADNPYEREARWAVAVTREPQTGSR
jgi:hypothetical protein